MHGRTCLVTGAAGFIGSHLVRRLVAQGAQVHALVRPETSLDRLVGYEDRLALHRVDLRDASGVKVAVNIAQPEFAFHLASPSRGSNVAEAAAARQSIDDVVKPLIGLVEALSGLHKTPRAFIRAGTIAEYGAVAVPYRERQRERPVTAYGAAMLAGTHYLDMLQAQLHFPAVTARLALTYGPDQSDSFLIPKLIDACLSGQKIVIKRPDDRRDLIHVDDVIDALLTLAQTRKVRSGFINVATGTAPSMREVAAEVISGTRCAPTLVDQCRPQPGDTINELRADPSLARETYAWGPQIGLRQGLSRLIESHRARTISTLELASGQAHG